MDEVLQALTGLGIAFGSLTLLFLVIPWILSYFDNHPLNPIALWFRYCEWVDDFVKSKRN